MFKEVHAEVDDPENSQEYGALNMKKKMDPKGLKKGQLMKEMNKKSTVWFWWTVVTNLIILIW